MIAINDKRFQNLFEFNFVETEEVTSEIEKQDPRETTTGISIAMLQDNVDIFALILTDIFNDCVSNETFAVEVKLAVISPILSQ